MWCFELQGKCHTSILPSMRPDIQEFQYRKFVVYGRDEFLETQNRNPKADAAHAGTVLECQSYPTFVFSREVVMFVIVINDEWKGGRICEHVCYWCAACADEAETQVKC